MTLEMILIVALALGTGAMAKGATGMGLPLVALPILATVLGLPHAIAILFVPVFMSNLWQVWAYRGHRHGFGFLPVFVAAGAAGIGLGTVFLASMSPDAVKLAMALLLFAYLALRLARPGFGLPRSAWRSAALGAGFAAGVAQGATGIASPVLATFLHSLRLKREAYVFAISVMFLLFSMVQIPALAIAGLIDWWMLVESALATLPVAVMMPAGAWLARHFGERLFDRAVLAMLAIMAVRFVLEGTGLW